MNLFLNIMTMALISMWAFACSAASSVPRDKDQLVGEFVERGERVTAAEITTGPLEGCLDDRLASRYDLEDGGWMYVFDYEDEQAAQDAAAGVSPNFTSGTSCRPLTWVTDVRYFLYGEVIVVMIRQDARQLAAIREIAGEPIACALGHEEPKEGVPRCELE